MSFEIVIPEEATPEHRSEITAPLAQYNLQHGPPPNFHTLAMLIRNSEGKTVGGLWGRFAYDWLFVEYLVVPAEQRRSGLGSTLMRRAEQLARERGCVGVWLDTFSSQALPFYEKLGYQRFGQIDDHPPGGARFFLQKRLA